MTTGTRVNNDDVDVVDDDDDYLKNIEHDDQCYHEEIMIAKLLLKREANSEKKSEKSRKGRRAKKDNKT